MAEPLSSGVQIASGGNRRAHARRTRLSGEITLAKGSSIARRFHDHEDGRLSLVRQRRPCVDQGDQISVRMAGVLRLTAGVCAGVWFAPLGSTGLIGTCKAGCQPSKLNIEGSSPFARFFVWRRVKLHIVAKFRRSQLVRVFRAIVDDCVLFACSRTALYCFVH